MLLSDKEYIEKWGKAAAVRCLKTAAQTAVALIGGDMLSVFALDWPQIVGVSVTAAIVSLLTSVAGLPEVEA